MGGVPSLLVLGGPATGKTLYGAQLLGRLQNSRGQLVLRGAPESISPLEDALQHLAQGRTARHTSSETYEEMRLPVEIPGRGSMDLIWPDYGGEQIQTMVQQRQFSPAWRQRIERSDGWLLFVRLDRIRSPEDILSRPPGEVARQERQDVTNDLIWSDQAVLVELLQLMLYARGVGTIRRVVRPALTVLLSCWDELTDAAVGTVPKPLLRQRMPLFLDFVSAVWRTDATSVFGLSSLGRALHPEKSDEEYVDYGPEQFGYVVLPSGERSSDLTLPIAMLLERVP